jgi:nitrite reductase/ring-hydroxylating ferredoxin subunit
MAEADGAGWCVARRALLAGLSGAGVVTLTGCGGDPAGSPGDQAAGRSSAAAPGSSAASAGPSPTPSYAPWPGGDGSGDGPGGGLVKTADVPVGGAVRVDNLLIAQPQKGVFKAFDATCPHQGFRVDTPIDGTDYFNCPGHNSKFRLADGSLISGPAPRGLRQVAVKVRDGYVVGA